MKFSLIAAILFCLLTAASVGGAATSKQSTHIVDDKPMDYESAETAVQEVPKRSDVVNVEPQSNGMVLYSTDNKLLTTWWVFGEKSPLYPSVVRRRIVGPPDGFVVKTAILCGAAQSMCERLRLSLELLDNKKERE